VGLKGERVIPNVGVLKRRGIGPGDEYFNVLFRPCGREPFLQVVTDGFVLVRPIAEHDAVPNENDSPGVQPRRRLDFAVVAKTPAVGSDAGGSPLAQRQHFGLRLDVPASRRGSHGHLAIIRKTAGGLLGFRLADAKNLTGALIDNEQRKRERKDQQLPLDRSREEGCRGEKQSCHEYQKYGVASDYRGPKFQRHDEN
jgi:hypothetical protein